MKIIPKDLHVAQKGHNTLTALINIDENINLTRNKNNNVVVLTTDLTGAYDTLDHVLIMITRPEVSEGGPPITNLINGVAREETDIHRQIEVSMDLPL